jgi:hypothetical protein
MSTWNWNIAQMTYIIQKFKTYYTGREKELKNTTARLNNWVNGGEEKNGPELRRLKNSNLQTIKPAAKEPEIDYVAMRMAQEAEKKRQNNVH